MGGRNVDQALPSQTEEENEMNQSSRKVGLAPGEQRCAHPSAIAVGQRGRIHGT